MIRVDLSGKKALVTGGSRGIGRAIVLALGEAGAYVYINYRSREKEAEETLKKLKSIGGDGELLPFDMSNLDAIETSLKGKDIDILVNNAGIAEDALLLRLSREKLERVLAVNLVGSIWTAKMVLRGMLKKKWGRIINISSIVGLSGNPGQVSYASSKAGLIGFTKSLAKEVSGRGITVNCIAPGFIETEMTEGFSEDEREKIISQIPLARLGKPEDVAGVVLFLSSDLSSYVTGEVINVSGGLYM